MALETADINTVNNLINQAIGKGKRLNDFVEAQAVTGDMPIYSTVINGGVRSDVKVPFSKILTYIAANATLSTGTKKVATIAERNAQAASMSAGELIIVDNASADAAVGSGWAIYSYTNGNWTPRMTENALSGQSGDERVLQPLALANSLSSLDATTYIDGAIIATKDLGVFIYDKLSTAAADGESVFAPLTGGGRFKQETNGQTRGLRPSEI